MLKENEKDLNNNNDWILKIRFADPSFETLPLEMEALSLCLRIDRKEVDIIQGELFSLLTSLTVPSIVDSFAFGSFVKAILDDDILKEQDTLNRYKSFLETGIKLFNDIQSHRTHLIASYTKGMAFSTVSTVP